MPTLGPEGDLRTAIDAIDAGIVAAVADLGLEKYRPRFSGIVRAIVRNGPSTINDLAAETSVSQSAASQTVTEMRARGLVMLERGTDERQRIVSLTPDALALLPAIDAEWAATTAALEALNAELTVPLSQTAAELTQALARRSFRQRIANAAGDLPDAVLGSYRAQLTDADSAAARPRGARARRSD
jgi:DNA-binding MarR family transcriptional regulator